QAITDRRIAVTCAPVSTSPGTENGGGTAPPTATSVFASSVLNQVRTSIIGPSGPNATSSRGIASEHHVGDVDHGFDSSDPFHQDGNQAESTTALPDGRRGIVEEPDDLVPLDEDELSLVGEQLGQARSIGRDLLSNLGHGVLPFAVRMSRNGTHLR